ncbi:MAG: cation transporter [Candidatus Omnitrophica bacterium]|nr:cation transporter [Candidatus Omnitrophota bacterium]
MNSGIEQKNTIERGVKASLTGILINVTLAMIKGTAGVVGNSYALVADAVESTLDIFSSVAVLGGIKIAAIPPDENHPYGHGKAEPLAAMVVAFVLMSVAIVLAIGSLAEIVSGLHRAPAAFTLYVLILVVLVKEVLFRWIVRIGNDTGSSALQADAVHHRSDAITSLTAFIGISIAIIGGKGYESADNWAALFAAGIIFYNAYRLLRPALDEIMDASPSSDMEISVRTVARTVDGVIGLDKCFIRKMGYSYYVDLHVVVDGNVSVRRGHEIAHIVKDNIKEKIPAIVDVIIHVEPARE